MTLTKLEGTLLYVKVQTPTACYEKEKGKEWQASIVVDEDTADAWDEVYPKQPAKRIKTSEFETLNKFAPPFPNEKKQYVITLRKNTLLNNGLEVPDLYQCKVFLKTEDGKQDITATHLVGNGSKGAMSVDHYDAKLGAVARLKNILVTDLIKYTKVSNESGSEFDDGVAVKPIEVRTAAKTPVKPVAKAKPESKPDLDTNEGSGSGDVDDDVPF